MGLFGKKKEETISEKSEEYVLKEELETEVENIQREFRVKQEELDGITEKIKAVKDEYDFTVGSLMRVKKELNQKKMELDVILREQKEIREKIKKSEKIRDSKSISEFDKTQGNFSKIKEELEEITKEYNETKKQVAQGQSLLGRIKKQQIEYEKELDEARSRLYNAKEELARKDMTQDTDVLTPKERKTIEGRGSNQESAGVIEAASVVVGSLKSKLNMAQKELEAIQLLLEEERAEHEKTKRELERLRKTKQS